MAKPSHPRIFTGIGAPLLCLAAAGAIAFLLPGPVLEPAERISLFVLVLAASLWLTEAIPAYAVSLLIMGLQIFLLGTPAFGLGESSYDWEIFIEPWASPLLWLFLGGFVLASGVGKTGLDRRLALSLLIRVRPFPGRVLATIMAVTFLSSMFMSNTATAAMVVAMMAPVVRGFEEGDPFGKALLLGVAFAASLGGLGTIIGSPPNAIAAAALEDSTPISFAAWMGAGLPVAMPLAILVWFYLHLRYPSNQKEIDFSSLREKPENDVASTQSKYVAVVFLLTVFLWLSSAWHGIPSGVVAFGPIMALTAGRVLSSDDIRKLPWDILILLAGGLSLGVGIRETGLAIRMVELLPLGGLSLFLLTLFFAYAACTLSNFMSNTAAANVLVPIGVAFAGSSGESIVAVSIALAASASMLLPISTPPNAIAFSKDRVKARDFLVVGLIVAVIAPPLVTVWSLFYFP